MLWYYKLALDGRLCSATDGAPIPGLTITNTLMLPVMVWWLDSDGQRHAWADLYQVIGSATQTSPPAQAGTWFLVTSIPTGSFVCAFQVQVPPEGQAPTYSITTSMLCDPNDIGPFPQTYDGTTLIPPDSPRVMVGCALGSDAVVVREQYWERMANSYCLAPNEVQVFSTTTTEGSQSTASSQTDVSSSLGLSASAGWGPVSASVSASLSTQSSLLQQVTVSQETTAYTSDTLTNADDVTRMYLRWQLTDVITLFTATGTGEVPLGSIILGANPVLTGKPQPVEQVNQG